MKQVRFLQQTVAAYMGSPAHCARHDASLSGVRALLEQYAISALPVLADDGRVLGMISLTDLLNVGTVSVPRPLGRFQLELPERRAAEVMTPHVLWVPERSSLAEATELMRRERVHRLCVEKDDKLVGILSVSDVMRAIADERVPTPVGELMSFPVLTVRAFEPTEVAASRLESADVRSLIVIEDGWPIGVFGQRQALRARKGGSPSRVEDWLEPRIVCVPPELPVHRAAAQALCMGADHLAVLRDQQLVGVLSELDVACAGLPHVAD